MDYDNDMDLAYPYEMNGGTLETTVVVINPGDPEGPRFEPTWDNMTNAIYWIVAHELLPVREYLDAQIEVLLPHGEKELAGFEGTAVDGLTAQTLMDAYREHQGGIRVVIEVHGDPEALKDEPLM